MRFVSDSPAKTKQLGMLLAKEILKDRGGDSAIIALRGNLGAGKTTFIQGFARGLGLKNKITSPTFIIFRHYRLRNRHRKHLFHVDAYRIKKISELGPLNLKEIFSIPKSIILIEWPEKIKGALPQKTGWLEFRHSRKENERIISINVK
ncbi:MAG: tRNA (adenosine(37)-N6)-threonylcarbamoyltransferase complex ATPase subunit type 1 TsaE [Minisyncoccia bacterium]|jgi:tRNA threonylcarbamoyladenosine biosynthesis protein TsaE